MTPDEAAQLLARAAAFDNRKPSAAAAQAWAAALHDVPLDGDTLAAVARYYGIGETGEGQRWIQPHHVRTHRIALRDERGHVPGPGLSPEIPDADPDDVAAYLRAIREQRTRAAEGQDVPALPAGAGDDIGYDNNPHVARIRRQFDAEREAARTRKTEEQKAERAALTLYTRAVSHLLTLPDHGAQAITAARDHLLSPQEAAQDFPALAATPGVMDEHKVTVWAARSTGWEEPCAPTAD